MIQSNNRAIKWLRVGRIGKAHGLRGSFFISERQELLPASYKTLRVGPSAESGQTLTITECRWQGGRPVVWCREVTSRSDAEKLVGLELWVERTQLAVDTEREYLWAEMAGRVVKSLSGNDFGVVRGIYNLGATDVIEVDSAGSRRYDIPVVADYFVLSSLPGLGPLQLAVPDAILEDLCQEPGH